MSTEKKRSTLKLSKSISTGDIKKVFDRDDSANFKIKQRKKTKAKDEKKEESPDVRSVLHSFSAKTQELKDRQESLREIAKTPTRVQKKKTTKDIETKKRKSIEKKEKVKTGTKTDKSEDIKDVDVFDALKTIMKKEQTPIEKKKSHEKSAEEDEDNEETVTKKDKKRFESRKKRKKHIHTYIISDDVSDEEDIKRLKRGIKSLRKGKKTKIKQEHQKISSEINLPDFITVAELSERMNEKKADVIKKLMMMGMPVTANQTIDADTAELVATELGHSITRVSEADVENILDNKEKGKEILPRAPVVTVMGHVDHGKTSLLDAIRSTNLLKNESGGITQHIGASRVEVSSGKFITFIDTPGHEAFTKMRMRGANITDIIILVIAADDGIKDQTIEAINHAKLAKAPIIVAINKMDKPGANPTKVKNDLLNHEIVAEELGGNTMFVEVSAKENTNIDKLKEVILLQAEMLELKAPVDTKASGSVIESKIDTNKGVVSTLLVQEGTLKIGDIVLAGVAYGKIRKMTDDKSKRLQKATPSMATEILGLNSAPEAGEQFHVVTEEKPAREIISYRERKKREAKLARRQGKTLDNILQGIGNSNKKQLNVIIKADTNGSIEAIIGSLIKLNTDEIEINTVHFGTGAINESDVDLASISNAIIIGFNVRANTSTKELAKDKDVDIRYYSIIYNIIDEVQVILSGMLDPIIREEKLGQAEIRQVFKVSGIGKVAGSYVTEGEIHRNAKARVIRDGVVVYDGTIKALKRFKEDAKEVKQGYECGISIENYNDIKEKDIIECYKIIEEKRG